MFSFKKYLYQNKVNIPSYYYLGNRRVQILHSKLRLECSALNIHIFRKNLTESLLCTCGSIETPYHYFLQWSRYRTARETALFRLNNPLNSHILSYRDANFSIIENEGIFKMVHEYILKTKIFWFFSLVYAFWYCTVYCNLLSIQLCTLLHKEMD